MGRVQPGRHGCRRFFYFHFFYEHLRVLGNMCAKQQQRTVFFEGNSTLMVRNETRMVCRFLRNLGKVAPHSL